MNTIKRFKQLFFRSPVSYRMAPCHRHRRIILGDATLSSAATPGLKNYRQKAIELALRRIDMVGIVPKLQDMAEFYTLQNALEWQLDPVAATDIETRLASYGFDQHTVSMEV